MVHLNDKYYTDLKVVASPMQSQKFMMALKGWTEAITKWKTREEEQTRS